MTSNYFIKDGYQANPVISFDEDSPEANAYWEIEDHLQGSASYQWPVYKALAKAAAARKAARVADVGCGSALKLMEVAKSLPDTTVVGFDQASAIRFCKKRHAGREFHQVNLNEPVVWSGAKFDIVNCSDVIEHVEKPEILLASLRALVSDDGVIMVSTPERDLTRGKSAQGCSNKYHVREWNQAEFEKFVTSQGFEIVSAQLLFPVKFGRPFRLLGDPLWRLLTFRPQRYNLLLTLKALK
ncbi:MAG: class I SAM-dependent methyltransferase [Myxococcales bacterium]|nr:class I SAM-dependent methyltransferase [Myxococcales bacterium]